MIMKLDEFIKEALVEIANGARMADDELCKMNKAGVNPEGRFEIRNHPCIVQNGLTKPVVSVNFKLHVQLEENMKSGGKLGAILNVISASYSSTKETSNVSVQEISVSMPIVLPSRPQPPR